MNNESPKLGNGTRSETEQTAMRLPSGMLHYRLSDEAMARARKMAGLRVGSLWQDWKDYDWPKEWREEDAIGDFVIYPDELEVLAQHWYRTALQIEADWLVVRSYGGEYAQRSYAYMRLVDIARCLGDEAVERAVEAVRLGFAATHDPELTHVVLYGTDEERAAFVRKMDELEARMNNERDAERRARGEVME